MITVSRNRIQAKPARNSANEALAARVRAMELPPPIREPLPGGIEDIPELSAPERRWAGEVLASDAVYVLVRSETLVDVGHWLGKAPLWVTATEADLVLFAAGRRPFSQRLPYESLKHALYNHVMGELVLAPAHPELQTRTIRLSPSAGYRILAQVYQKETDHA